MAHPLAQHAPPARSTFALSLRLTVDVHRPPHWEAQGFTATAAALSADHDPAVHYYPSSHSMMRNTFTLGPLDLARVYTVVKLRPNFFYGSGESGTLGSRWEILLEEFTLAADSAAQFVKRGSEHAERVITGQLAPRWRVVRLAATRAITALRFRRHTRARPASGLLDQNISNSLAR